MANSKFFYHNYITQAETETTIVSGGENPFYPVSNLKHPHALKTFRSTSTTVVLQFDMQTIVTINAFLSVASSIGTLDLTAVTIEANAVDEWSAPAFSTSVVDFDYEEDIATLFFDDQSYRYWRITLTGTSDYVEVGKIFLGSEVSLDKNNIDIGFSFKEEDISDVSTGRYGQRYIDEITTVNTIKASISLMTKEEQAIIQDMYRYCGTRKPVWIVIDPDEVIVSNKDVLSGYYYFKTTSGFVNDFYGLYSTNFELEQAK